MVQVLTHIENLGGLCGLGSEYSVRRAAYPKGWTQCGRLDGWAQARCGGAAHNQGAAHHMAGVIRRMKNGVGHAVDAVFHHALTLQIHQGQGQATLVIFS